MDELIKRDAASDDLGDLTDNTHRTRIYFTIASKNYLAYAATLMQSIERADPSGKRFLVIVDEVGELPDIRIPAQVIYANQLEIPSFKDMTLRYSIMELNTAVKPYAFLWLLERNPEGICYYVDPDIYVFRRMDIVESRLENDYELALTPHITKPLQDGKSPDDLTIMKSGIWNMGFAALRASPETLDFLRWWAERCSTDCRSAVDENIFTDQRWIDLAPCFVPKTTIIRDPGYNLAYWNLSHRRVSITANELQVEGNPVTFVHYSGVIANNPEVFSKHQNRFTPDDIGDLRPFFDSYRERLLANCWELTNKIPYSYAKTKRGRTISEIARRNYQSQNPKPLSVDEVERDSWNDRIVDCLDEIEPTLESLGPPFLTKLVFRCWKSRSDLQAHFAVMTSEGRRGLLGWFANSAKREHGVDETSLQAASVVAVLGRGADLKSSLRWPPVSARFVDIPSRKSAITLSETVDFVLESGLTVSLPKAFALVWEQRGDLRQAFPLNSIASWRGFVRWCFETGPREGAVDVETLRRTRMFFVQQLAADSQLGPLLGAASEQVFHGYDDTFGHLQSGIDLGEDSKRAALTAFYVYRFAKNSMWPNEYCTHDVDWLNSQQPGLLHDFPISRLLYRIYRVRPDLMETFDVKQDLGAMGLLGWFLCFGVQEYGLDSRCISDAMKAFYLRAAKPPLTNLEMCVWAVEFPKEANVDFEDPAQRAHIGSWFRSESAKKYLAGAGFRALFDKPQKHAPKYARLAVSGYWDAASGRGEDVRMTKRALDTVGVDAVVLDRVTYQPEALPEGLSRPLQADICIAHFNAESSYIDHVWLRNKNVRSAYNIGYWAWELSEFPDEWMNAFQFYDEIWASTEFARASFASKSPRPVTLMPMVVENPTRDPSLGREHFKLPHDAFLFFFHFDFRSFVARKNPDAAIRAFLKAFSGIDASVGLVIKTINRQHNPSGWERIKALTSVDPRIILMDCELSRVEVTSLIDCCDCYVSLHRSEGFGRGMAEAMLLEKPVICTSYSGNLDFCNSDTAYLVNFDLIPVQPHEYIGAEQQVWADAHVDHAAELMREVFDNEEKRNRIARNGAEFVRSQYSAERVGRIYQGRINEILKSAQLSYPARSTGAAPLNGNDARSSILRKLFEKASLSISR